MSKGKYCNPFENLLNVAINITATEFNSLIIIIIKDTIFDAVFVSTSGHRLLILALT